MTYFQILKKILKNFKAYTGNTKFYTLVFVLFITTILGSSEPFFSAKLVEYIEKYLKNSNFILAEI
jgi:hypothetical protein